MSEAHLYPARPGMLRRGTPAAVVNEMGRADHGVWLRDGYVVAESGSGVLDPIKRRDDEQTTVDFIDLRSPTARAHAAWPYIGISNGQFVLKGDLARLLDTVKTFGYIEDATAAMRHVTVLIRMSCGDEDVTVAEARAALDWAGSMCITVEEARATLNWAQDALDGGEG